MACLKINNQNEITPCNVKKLLALERWRLGLFKLKQTKTKNNQKINIKIKGMGFYYLDFAINFRLEGLVVTPRYPVILEYHPWRHPTKTHLDSIYLSSLNIDIFLSYRNCVLGWCIKQWKFQHWKTSSSQITNKCTNIFETAIGYQKN